jgi:hypothetical protein
MTARQFFKMKPMRAMKRTIMMMKATGAKKGNMAQRPPAIREKASIM